MSTPIKDGGMAFARPTADGYPGQQGMALRDYFAGQALAMLASPLLGRDIPDNVPLGPAVAEAAYKYADAMIAAREVQP